MIRRAILTALWCAACTQVVTDATDPKSTACARYGFQPAPVHGYRDSAAKQRARRALNRS